MQDTPKRADPFAMLTGRLGSARRPRAISLPGEGGKFATDGRVQPWPGNTFLCHVDPASPQHAALREMQEQVKKSPFNRFFTFLPPSSFHMTVFQGISPATQAAGVLPRGAEAGMTRDALTAHMLALVSGLSLPDAFRVRMTDLHALHSVTMTGATEADEAALRQTRRTLLDATGFAEPRFEAYVFHITLAYLIDWISDATAAEIVAFSAEVSERYPPVVGEIPLGPVEFCTFETMHHFEPIVRLGYSRAS